MLTAEQAHAGLMRRLLAAGGDAFRYAVPLGRFEVRERLAANGWQPDGRSVSHAIAEGKAAFRTLEKEFPALQIAFPDRLCTAQIFQGGTARVQLFETSAAVSVPAAFSREKGGAAFCDYLRAEWRQPAEKLTGLIAKRLRRHELRTVRMFGAPASGGIAFTLDREYAESAIWSIALADCGFYPLLWEQEVFGMARLLRDDLCAALRPACGGGLNIRLACGDEACRLTLEY